MCISQLSPEPVPQRGLRDCTCELYKTPDMFYYYFYSSSYTSRKKSKENKSWNTVLCGHLFQACVVLNSRRFHHNLHKVLILTASLCELNKKNHFFVSKAGSEVQLYQIHLHEVLCWGARMRCLMWSQNVDLSHEMLSISSTFWLVFPKVHNEKETFLLILFFPPPPLALVLFYI